MLSGCRVTGSVVTFDDETRARHFSFASRRPTTTDEDGMRQPPGSEYQPTADRLPVVAGHSRRRPAVFSIRVTCGGIRGVETAAWWEV